MLSKPLSELTGKAQFHWGGDQQKAFVSLKERVSTAPVLRPFDPSLPIYLSADASGQSIGAVLEQEKHGTRRPVAYFSRTLNVHEQRYVIRELELLAIVCVVRHWRAYLYGARLTVFTDHESLEYLETQHKLSDRQVRWLELLHQYDFRIVPVRGPKNRVADSLSRQSHEDCGNPPAEMHLLEKVVKDEIRTRPTARESRIPRNTTLSLPQLSSELYVPDSPAKAASVKKTQTTDRTDNHLKNNIDPADTPPKNAIDSQDAGPGNLTMLSTVQNHRNNH